MRDLVSVIMPVYNGQSTLARAVSSVLAQRYGDWELVIVDDQSSDFSYELMRSFANSEARIRVFQLSRNSGAGAARNRAIEVARGRFIAFLDADDEWFPDKLSRQIAFMHDTVAAFSCTAYDRIKKNGVQRTTHVPKRVNYFDLLRNNTVGTLTAIYDADVLGKNYMPLIRRRQDYALWLELLKLTNHVYGLDESLAIYHQSEGSLSANKLVAAHNQWRMFRDVEKLSISKAAWYFGHYAVNASRRNR